VSDSGRGERRRGLLYGRRKGPKLSAHQAKLVANLLPQLKLLLAPNLDPSMSFNSRIDEVWLEIGFGSGEHLLWQAEHHPHVGIVGAEAYEGGIARLLSRLVAAPGGSQTLASRIRIHDGDARDILEALPEACLGRAFILFPDPWPKTRHHKRRFVQTETLDALARVLQDGMQLRFASDDPGYVAWTLERVMAHEFFVWTAERERDWHVRPADWPPTRYEQKALHGVPVFLTFQRRPRQGLQCETAERK
jgi:tRNA (guanine-N7-)-methyltransferase